MVVRLSSPVHPLIRVLTMDAHKGAMRTNRPAEVLLALLLAPPVSAADPTTVSTLFPEIILICVLLVVHSVAIANILLTITICRSSLHHHVHHSR